jgi:hypothetical protein
LKVRGSQALRKIIRVLREESGTFVKLEENKSKM